jgi:hypothetical protein
MIVYVSNELILMCGELFYLVLHLIAYFLVNRETLNRVVEDDELALHILDRVVVDFLAHLLVEYFVARFFQTGL